MDLIKNLYFMHITDQAKTIKKNLIIPNKRYFNLNYLAHFVRRPYVYPCRSGVSIYDTTQIKTSSFCLDLFQHGPDETRTAMQIH